MSTLKISPDQFLGDSELNMLTQSLDSKGFRKNILQNSVSFGLIKNTRDPLFSNGLVQRDVDTGGQRTIKINQLYGIDVNGNFINLAPQSTIPVPSDGNWYWVKVAYAISNLEAGTFSISANGDLIDTSGNATLTQILRGMPNFPSRIKFTNSQYNTLEYDVLDVIDDQHATIQQPATNTNGISQFTPETGLTLSIVGTFTPPIAVPTGSKFPFNYDSAAVTLVVESLTNTPPTPYVQNVEFYIARIKDTGTNLIIQDKRTQYWETKGSGLPIAINRTANPLVGVESTQFNNVYSPGDKNIVKIAWGMRSNAWTINSSANTVTFSSGLGGKYKSVNDFNNGDFDGWRLYTPSGKYHMITSSIKQGSAINLILDNLDVNNFSTDGGTTFISGYLMACPDCDEVEILFTPDPAANVPAIQQAYTFPVNELIGRCDVLVFGSTALYNVQYRYKAFKEFTGYTAIPTDTTYGYYPESSFDTNGNIISSPTRVQYTSDPVNGFITLALSPLAIYNFRNTVYKGDVIGVEDIDDLSTTTLIQMTVGTTKNFLNFTGNITLGNNVVMNFNTAGSIEGNEFRVRFNCTTFNLASFSFTILQNQGLSSQLTLKTMSVGDFYQMLNQDGGIVLTFRFDGENWLMSENYKLGKSLEIIKIDGVPSTLFDSITGLGKVKGLFGYVICDGSVSSVNGISIPNLKQQFLVGQDSTISEYNAGQTGGEATHTLTEGEMPNHNHDLTDPGHGHTYNGTISNRDRANDGLMYRYDQIDPPDADGTATLPTSTTSITIAAAGGGEAHNNVPPYYAVIYAKKIF